MKQFLYINFIQHLKTGMYFCYKFRRYVNYCFHFFYSTYLSFTVDNNELTLSEINDKITSKDIVDSVIPIISISQGK